MDGTIRALDLARILSSSLYRKAPPLETLARARSLVSAEAGAKGEAQVGTLMDATRVAYRARDYSDTLNFARRNIKASSSDALHGQYLSWAHTLAGLAFLAQGNQEQAAFELTASLQIPTGRLLFLPSMALAKAMLDKQPKAVIAFLDTASHLEAWKGKTSALAWKADVEQGRVPDFRDLESVGL